MERRVREVADGAGSEIADSITGAVTSKVDGVRFETRIVASGETKWFVIAHENAEITDVVRVCTNPFLGVLPKDHDIASLYDKIGQVVHFVFPFNSFSLVRKGNQAPMTQQNRVYKTEHIKREIGLHKLTIER